MSFREFFIAIARAEGRFIAVGRDRSGKQVARTEGPAIDEVEGNLKSELLKLSNDFVDLPGAINLFRRPAEASRRNATKSRRSAVPLKVPD